MTRCTSVKPQRADRDYVRILHVAASTSEAEVELALGLLLDQASLPSFDAVRDLVRAPVAARLPVLGPVVIDVGDEHAVVLMNLSPEHIVARWRARRSCRWSRADPIGRRLPTRAWSPRRPRGPWDARQATDLVLAPYRAVCGEGFTGLTSYLAVVRGG